MAEKDKFFGRYRALNLEQKKAVDAIEGPVMVIAGPGTGKTQILTLRIANILRKTDTAPENILALAFTESAVISMRRRLAEIIGSPAYSVVISTFHGFCNDIIQNYPEEFPRIIGSQNINEVDQINLIQEAITVLPLKLLKPFGDKFYYLRPTLAAINALKREGIASAAFKKIAEREQKEFKTIPELYYEKGKWIGKMRGKYKTLHSRIEKWLELARIYSWYQKELQKRRLYDFSDMIMEVLKTLEKDPEFLLILQEQYHYILVDEHQDTNNAQNKILELLCDFHQNPNIFVVGDQKQAIFRFQGASLENFNYFKKLYPKAELIALKENYRSTQIILDAAQSLLPHSEVLTAKNRNAQKPISVFAFSKPDDELYFVSRDILEKIHENVNPAQMAILYRDNKDAIGISEMLERFGVLHIIESDQNILEDANIKKLLLLLRAVSNFGADEYFLEALHIDFLNILPLDIYRLAKTSYEKKNSVFDIAESKSALSKLNLNDSEAIYNFYVKLSNWFRLSKNAPLPEFFENVTRDSGFLAYLLQKQTAENLDNLTGVFNELKSFVEKHKNAKLNQFLKHLDAINEHGISINRGRSGRWTQRVRLMTAHRAKGLEFEYVYLINAYDGHWGNRRRPNLLPLPPQIYALSKEKISEPDSELDDERRLFYVALTRAKKQVVITYSKQGQNSREQLPSRFTQEIRPELLEFKDATAVEEEFGKKRELLFAPRVKNAKDISEKEFISELFAENGLSVTALNNFLECPWKYFYVNLLRVPKAQTESQLYGTAMHETLRDFFNSFKEKGVWPKEQFFYAKLKYYLNQKPLAQSAFKQALSKGTKTLKGYYKTYKPFQPLNFINEFKIKGLMLYPNVRLTGIIDKMEFLGTGNKINIVDYKTGKPKTRGFIEGKVKNSNGNIKRQLAFYKLLLNLYENGRYKMVSADIDFVEPDKDGRYHKERYMADELETSKLKKLILDTAENILSLGFWDSRCDDSSCKYCALRDTLKV